ncbi:MAG: hypothetical protein OQK12_06200 [Motiliproteus sp.]|nr:hypothetical protein [Motiliproteus sp.]MCW9051680.1 hypothetical protein [Motiliproteus sp.]
MTTEVSVMNKHAVALAADSAVTISVSSDIAPKIFHSVDKLFMLSKSRPVGIMIYGSASLMRIPWETLIKQFRRQLGDRDESHLEDYAVSFIGFLGGLNRRQGSDLNFVEQWHIIRFLKAFRQRTQHQLEGLLTQSGDKSETLTEDQQKKLLRKAMTAAISDFGKFVEGLENLEYMEGHQAKELMAVNKSWVDQVMAEVLNDLPVTASQKKKLLALMVDAVEKEFFFSENDSGVVIAGFGEEELYPVMVRCNFEGFLFDKLKYGRYQVTKIDDNCRSYITPFAQGDEISAFIQGIDPGFMIRIQQSMQNYGSGFIQQLQTVLSEQKVPEGQIAEMVSAMSEYAGQQGESLNASLGQYSQQRYIDPVVDAVAFLPKHELSHLAESLVTLTSLRKKMSTESETVGGPVDVAVISKGDGFIWIKRKNYFDPQQNFTKSD